LDRSEKTKKIIFGGGKEDGVSKKEGRGGYLDLRPSGTSEINSQGGKKKNAVRQTG